MLYVCVGMAVKGVRSLSQLFDFEVNFLYNTNKRTSLPHTVVCDDQTEDRTVCVKHLETRKLCPDIRGTYLETASCLTRRSSFF